MAIQRNHLKRLLLDLDLSTQCTECGYAIPPVELLATGWYTKRCPRCGKDFVPKSKGNCSRLGG